jgi:hypothetical protein
LAVILTDVDSRVLEVLDLLDGTREWCTVVRQASLAGMPAEHATALLSLLDDAGALDDASLHDAPRPGRIDAHAAALGLRSAPEVAATARRRRRAATVQVVGRGRVAETFASLLHAAGVGDAVTDDAPGSRRPDLVVLVDDARLEPARLDWLLREDVEHLSIGVREVSGVVGPLTVPGRSACLRCLDHHRADRDPLWPRLAAQLATHSHAGACDLVQATMIAALGVLQALARLDGEAPATIGGTLEVTLPDWRVRRRSWPLHPGCGCAAFAEAG